MKEFLDIVNEKGVPTGQTVDRTIIWDDVFFGKEYHDRQYTRVFVLWKDLEEMEFCLQKEELDSVRWMDLGLCIQGVKDNSFRNCIEMEELLMVKDAVAQRAVY